jgi:hypothetical protein
MEKLDHDVMLDQDIEDRFYDALAEFITTCEDLETEAVIDPSWEPCEADIESIEFITTMLLSEEYGDDYGICC